MPWKSDTLGPDFMTFPSSNNAALPYPFIQQINFFFQSTLSTPCSHTATSLTESFVTLHPSKPPNWHHSSRSLSNNWTSQCVHHTAVKKLLSKNKPNYMQLSVQHHKLYETPLFCPCKHCNWNFFGKLQSRQMQPNLATTFSQLSRREFWV